MIRWNDESSKSNKFSNAIIYSVELVIFKSWNIDLCYVQRCMYVSCFILVSVKIHWYSFSYLLEGRKIYDRVRS